jgi:hypothetical protein
METLEQLEQLEQKYKELGEEIKKLKSQDRLHLEIFGTSLCVLYKDKIFLEITEKGLLITYPKDSTLDAFYEWLANNMPTDYNEIEWRGGTYGIAYSYNLKRTDIGKGAIYNFDDCATLESCEDENIIRYKHNNRPIIF